ncbi:MAG: hypothetical protein PV340_05800 [Wolbachia sp.]|nr:hypothetical protein [Wolbachia sp.]MDD9336433.1 hypothetical protein [Wolbachia sp.]
MNSWKSYDYYAEQSHDFDQEVKNLKFSLQNTNVKAEHGNLEQ